MFYNMVIRVAVLTSIPLQQIPYIFYHPFLPNGRNTPAKILAAVYPLCHLNGG